MPGAMESLGALELKDGNLVISEGGREKAISTKERLLKTGNDDSPFPCAPKVTPSEYQIDLRDRKKYFSWHDRWIDGLYLNVLKTLNVQPQFAIPVFDPTGVASKLGLEVPDLSLNAIIGCFAMPQSIPLFLNIKPPEIPSFLLKMFGLIVPPILPIPQLPEIPDFYVGLDFPDFPKFPSVHGFNISFLQKIPFAFEEMLKITLDPLWWLDFSPGKLFEAGCQSVQKIIPAPLSSNSSSLDSNTAMLVTLTGEALASAVAGTVIGATALLKKLGEQLGYRVKSTEEIETDDSKASLNRLSKLQPNEKNMVIPFERRRTFYGDPLAIETINALSDHMWNDKSYRISDIDESVTLEIGNICRFNRENVWSKTHAGMSFDMAYPLRDEKGDWMSGVNENYQSLLLKEDIRDDGPVYNQQSAVYKGDPNVPLYVNKKLLHDFPALYEIGRFIFQDWQIKLFEDQALLSWSGDNKLITAPYQLIIIGPKIFEEFNKWATEKYGRKWNNCGNLYSSRNFKRASQDMFAPEKRHEDHIHFVGHRTRKDNEKSTPDKNVYRVYPGPGEGVFKFDNESISDPSDLTNTKKIKVRW